MVAVQLSMFFFLLPLFATARLVYHNCFSLSTTFLKVFLFF